MNSKKTKLARAWIVRYKSPSRYKELNNKILSVLKWQKSPEQIREKVVQLYVDNLLSQSERIRYLKNKDMNGLAYPPRVYRSKSGVTILIGHDPQLEALQVKNLEATGPEWDETLSWEYL